MTILLKQWERIKGGLRCSSFYSLKKEKSRFTHQLHDDRKLKLKLSHQTGNNISRFNYG